MFKICGDTICKHLELIFKQALAIRVFPSEWKKDYIAPCYKKNDKQNLKNYRPVSLLPICIKMFKRLILNEMLSFFLANNLLVPNQSELNQVTLVSISIYQLLMIFIHLLFIFLLSYSYLFRLWI